MEVFWRLILAHLLTDFTFQTDFIARWKRSSLLGGFVHSFIFFACASMLTVGYLDEVWLNIGTVAINGWGALALLTLFHFMEDEWRIWTIQKKNSPDSFFFFLLDQFIHVALIFIFFPRQNMSFPEQWVIFAILFVLTTHFTSIFLYFIEKDLFGYTRLLTNGKYYAMAERLMTALTLLLPGWWGFIFLSVWLVRVFTCRSWREHDYSRISVILGNVMAILFGLLARIVLYSGIPLL